MSVKIRLQRIGRKKQPTYRIVVTASQNSRSGSIIESLGYYSPYLRDKPLKIDFDRLESWVGKGAICTESVQRIIRQARRKGKAAPAVAAAKSEKAASEPVAPVATVEPAAENVSEPADD